MAHHRHPTLERIVRRLKPTADSFAAAAAVYTPEVMLQLHATKGAQTRSATAIRSPTGDELTRAWTLGGCRPSFSSRQPTTKAADQQELPEAL